MNFENWYAEFKNRLMTKGYVFLGPISTLQRTALLKQFDEDTGRHLNFADSATMGTRYDRTPAMFDQSVYIQDAAEVRVRDMFVNWEDQQCYTVICCDRMLPVCIHEPTDKEMPDNGLNPHNHYKCRVHIDGIPAGSCTYLEWVGDDSVRVVDGHNAVHTLSITEFKMHFSMCEVCKEVDPFC